MAIASLFRPPMVGLDIGSGSVKAVVLRRSRNAWSLAGAAEVAAPATSTRSDEEAPQSPELSESVGQAFDALNLKRARVAAALSGHSVVVKRLSLPAMTQAELSEAIPWEAEQYVPFDLNDVQLDYQVIESPGDPEKNTLDVLLVAAKRDRIDDRSAVIAQSGRQPVVLDIEAFALANAYQMNYPERSDALVALLHIGRSQTIVCLLEKGEPVFTRDMAIGGQVHFDALVRDFAGQGVDELAARRILNGQMPSSVNADQVTAALREASAQVVLEVRKTIDFYRATAPVEQLSRVVVSGGACQAVGLTDLLAAEFNAPVDVLDPFRRVVRSSRAVGAELAGPAFAVAVGLAMRQEGDR